LLENDQELDVVACCADGAQALQAVKNPRPTCCSSTCRCRDSPVSTC
jgi:hypothetical protein